MDVNKPCECWVCKHLSPAVKKFESSLTPQQLEEFRVLWDELWGRYEAESTDYNVLLSKIEGSWPKEDGDKYYERVGDKLYEVSGNLVKETNSQ